jgi:hypothetical protein
LLLQLDPDTPFCGAHWGYFEACTEAQIAAPTLPTLNEKCLAQIPTAHLKSERYSAVAKGYTRSLPPSLWGIVSVMSMLRHRKNAKGQGIVPPRKTTPGPGQFF